MSELSGLEIIECGIINLKNLSKLNPAIAKHPFWTLAMEQLENGVKTLYKED